MARKVVIDEIVLLNLLTQVRRAQGKLWQVKGGRELINEIDDAIYIIGKQANEYQPDMIETFLREVSQ